MDKDIVIFDGDCNFCNKYINFVIAHDHANQFVFTSSGSLAGRALLNKYNIDPSHTDSIILISGERVYTFSDAVLGIIKHFDNHIRRLYFLRIIPKHTRDYLYKYFAKHRYILFGKSTHCQVPTAAVRAKFLE